MNSSTNRRKAAVRGVLVLGGMMALISPYPTQAQDAEKLTLRQAVVLALQNSRELKLARMQYNVALDEARVDRAEFRPNLYTGAGAAYTHGFPSLPGGQAPSVFQLDYTQTLFNPLLKGQQRAAEERAKNQKIEMDRTRDGVIVRTATVYLELAKVKHSLELMRAEEASAEKILGVVRERVGANQELPIEVTRSQLTLARIRERIVKLGDRADILEAQIRDLTAIPESQSIEVDQEEPSFAEALSAEPAEAGMVDLAVRNDRSVAEAENERSAREHILRGARLSYWPTVDLVGQYSVLSKFNNYEDFYKTFERNNFNIGLQVTIPIFAAKTSANVALAKSQLNAAELSLGQKRQEVRLDAQQKFRSVRESDASRDVARLDLQLAQETLQLVQAKFDQGRATLQDVEQARLDESDKWVAFLDADFARQQAQLALLEATGQLAKVFP
ncbi:MAG TPA: TolC family protein [Candidatus Polarisedimenticolia bacterium]|nr:TolC family protein [Candidatus Polarisedimenticolia bacterium]